MHKRTFRLLIAACFFAFVLLLIGIYYFGFIYPKEKTFREHLPSGDVNDTIQMYRDPFTDYPFKFGKIIDLGVRNQSKEMVVFLWDGGVRLYFLRDGVWIRVVDNLKRRYIVKTGNNTYNAREILPTDLFHLPPNGEEYDGEVSNGMRIVSASPVLDLSDVPTMLRFMVIGTIYRDGQPTDEQVAAYMDIKIVP